MMIYAAVTQYMEPSTPVPDSAPRTNYEQGIELFNRGDFFEAHEVWEELWLACPAAERRFFQALIQAAVALHHFGRGNYTGASRLFHSGRRYMEPYRPTYLGLDVEDFWRRMELHLALALVGGHTQAGTRPVIALSPSADSHD
jgi:predicted metal-dependent hydrolase